MEDRYTCEICDAPLAEDYDPGMCCSGFECGCMGQPTNPPICSQDCWDKMLERIGVKKSIADRHSI